MLHEPARMILASHPGGHASMFGLRALGYWDDGRNGLPRPQDFVDPSWDPRLRKLASLYLSSAPVAESWRGSSWCRFSCQGLRNGSQCLSDGIFVWPQGLPHYVERHAVRLPDEFMDHIVARMRSGDFDLEQTIRATKIK